MVLLPEPGDFAMRNDMTCQDSAASAQNKAPTGIAGFDEITGGGLPRGRATLQRFPARRAAAKMKPS
jgi:hypothetical protein